MALDPLTEGIGLVRDAVNKFLPNAGELEKAQLNAELAVILGQLEVNKVEAGSMSIFVAGWRPYIGWVCGGALTYQYVVRPLLPWLIALIAGPIPDLPAIDIGDLVAILTAMLGMSTLRTYEKQKGVSK